jgi:hypothetical protein
MNQPEQKSATPGSNFKGMESEPWNLNVAILGLLCFLYRVSAQLKCPLWLHDIVPGQQWE